MKTVLHVLPVSGLAMLLLAGCQTQQSPSAQPVSQAAPTRATPATPVVDPINDPSLRDSNNDSGGGGGNDSPGGGGGSSWGN